MTDLGRLNPTKTQVMWLGSGQQLKHVDINDIPVLSTTDPVVESARDLGVIFDSRLTLSADVAALCRAGYQLRQLRQFVQSMTAEAARTVAAAFISYGWIIVIRCSTVCRTFYAASCSLCRTPLHD